VRTLVKFKNGDINCIFATSVAEEGLDIPDCNIVIRFNLAKTLIQYIQSRGRARQGNSIYIHMLEHGNLEHRDKVVRLKQNEDHLRKFCESLPENRKLTGNTFDMDYFLRKERNQRQYTVPETGAKLNYKQSLTYVASFVASLPHPPEVELRPNYVILAVPGGYQCEVILPESSPIRNAMGRVYSSKAVAKCSAAYEMCLVLIQNKYLDKHLRPVFTKQLPAMRNARLALSSKKQKEYDMRLKPEIWSRTGEPAELYIMILTLANPAALGYPSAPLLLLARETIHEIPPFPLFFGNGRTSPAALVAIPGRLSVDKAQAEALTAFTLTVFKDVFNKEYDATAAQLPYFLAPTQLEHTFNFQSLSGNPGAAIDWATIDFVQQNEQLTYSYEEEPDEFFHGKFVVDPYDGSRRFFLRRRRADMKPTDTVPEGVPNALHRPWAQAKGDDRCVLNWSYASWSKHKNFRTALRQDQPVVEADLLPIRRNLLDDNYEDANQFKSETCFIVLECMKISPASLTERP
jgi:endoribonuclease Dicer